MPFFILYNALAPSLSGHVLYQCIGIRDFVTRLLNVFCGIGADLFTGCLQDMMADSVSGIIIFQIGSVYTILYALLRKISLYLRSACM